MNNIITAAILALKAIRSYRLRAFLTTFGIAIGIFAITFVFTLVNSMETAVSKNLSELGNTVFFIHHWPWKDNSEDWFKYYNRPKVSYKDYQVLSRNLSNIQAISLTCTKGGNTVKSELKRTASEVSIRGVTFDFDQITDLQFEYGRYFSAFEVESGRNVCIIGHYIARSLFDEGPYLNRYLYVNGRKLRVIGVLAKKGKNLFGDSQDEYFLVPFACFGKMYAIENRSVDKVISVKVADYEQIPEVESQTIGLLRLSRGLKTGVEDNFSINKQEALMEQLQKLFDYLNLGGVIISVFSLLIGGFGIANIMFVSVKERTKEIGIQKSLGATRAYILLQFLIEAIVLCVLGGLVGLGILFSIAGLASFALSFWMPELIIVIKPADLVIGLVISAVIGLLSGIIPSYAAAQLDPVEAMRSK
jgi:putative ABC transport system permease protein